MIKLFWNTHNQKKPSTVDDKIIKKHYRDKKWGLYHKANSDIWVYEILKKIKYNIIDSETKLEETDTLIIVDSSIEDKSEFYSKLKLTCSKIYLIHLGDETSFFDLNKVYENCNYVWRTFCSKKYFENNHVECIPIGYKSGVLNKKKTTRQYKWSFIGTPHKSSRHDLLFQFSEIKPFFCHKTEEFDKEIISVEKMNEVLSLTEFVPCPNGFVHPETYRLYEALECDCIPIVESTYHYYDRLFPNNPFIKVNKWIDAKSIIENWDNDKIKRKKKECITWWNEYKSNVQESIKNKVNL